MAISISTPTTCRPAKTTQVTNNKVWDVRWPSADNNDRIVYEMNGELQVLGRQEPKELANFHHRSR